MKSSGAGESRTAAPPAPAGAPRGTPTAVFNPQSRSMSTPAVFNPGVFSPQAPAAEEDEAPRFSFIMDEGAQSGAGESEAGLGDGAG